MSFINKLYICSPFITAFVIATIGFIFIPLLHRLVSFFNYEIILLNMENSFSTHYSLHNNI
ncbi:hypothetical protein, partial [Bacillus pseudomycoides]|uniref:hypothetical protein n=1 Tax=Bacillus pseudomycoides TaxID=64104 RepID=UPI001C54D8C7